MNDIDKDDLQQSEQMMKELKGQQKAPKNPDRLRIVLEANKCKIYQGDKDITPPHVTGISIFGIVGEYPIVIIPLIANEIEIESQDAHITEAKEDESLIKIGGKDLDIPLRKFLNELSQKLASCNPPWHQ